MAGHRKHHGRAILDREQCVAQLLDPAEHLSGRHTCGQGKIKTVYLALGEQMHEAPQRRLGLAGSRLGFQHHTLRLRHGGVLLDRTR